MQDKLKVTYSLKALVKKAVKATLKYEGIKNSAEVSVTFTDNESIRVLNAQYRSIDRATDVLSFPMFDFNSEDDIDEIVKEKNARVLLGDIVICKTVAKRQAKEFAHSFKREICFLALHGFLHLLGYDHIEKQDEEIMQSVANEILEKNKIYR